MSSHEGTNSQDDGPMIEPDSFPASDDEATFDKSDEDASTCSLTDSVYALHRENGRTYHGYRAGTYPFPNDDREVERLDYQYLVIAHALEQRLHFAPLSDPRHILDIGTGTGVWAIEMGDQYPNAKIEATDLSPIQPLSVPENVQFLIDDTEQEDWCVDADHYDYIHTRVLLGCFQDFRDIIAKGFLHLKPGAWMESQELMSTPYCDDGTMPDDWPLLDWTRRLDAAAMEGAARPLRIANRLKKWYIAAGFVDVHEHVVKLPVNDWPRDPEMKLKGLYWAENLLQGMSAFSLAYFTRMLMWTPDEIQVYLINIRKAILDRRVHAYHNVYVVWGRKPYPGEGADILTPELHPDTCQPTTFSSDTQAIPTHPSHSSVLTFNPVRDQNGSATIPSTPPDAAVSSQEPNSPVAEMRASKRPRNGSD